MRMAWAETKGSMILLVGKHCSSLETTLLKSDWMFLQPLCDSHIQLEEQLPGPLEIIHPAESMVQGNVYALYLGEGSIYPVLLGYLIYFSLAFNMWPFWLAGNDRLIHWDNPSTRE